MPDLLGHRRQARHPAARLRHLRRRGRVVSSVGGGFSMNETCPECHGRQLVYDETLPDLPRVRSRALQPDDLRAHPGRGQGRPAHPAQGQGRRPGRTAGPTGTCSSPCTCAATGSSGARATTSRSRCRSPSTRPPSAPRSRCPTLGGAPVTLRIPPGTPNGRVLRVRGRGAPRKDGCKGDLLVTVDVQVPAELDEATRAAVTAYREARRAVPTRAPHCSRGCVMPHAGPGAGPQRAGPRTDGPRLRDQRGGRAHRAAPADPAAVRPRRPGLARAAPAAAAGATPCATSSCCARSPS